jgi:serine/threonine protein kinase
MHKAGVIHRDLKPANILVDEETCHIRLADFGLSRGKVVGEALPGEGSATGAPNAAGAADAEQSEMSLYVVTRWYRAPELMLEYDEYDHGIDIWSMGCILGELFARKPLMQGRNTLDQLKITNQFIGRCVESWLPT